MISYNEHHSVTNKLHSSNLRLTGGRSSMVEPQIVILVVAGSSPVGHPIPSFPIR